MSVRIVGIILRWSAIFLVLLGIIGGIFDFADLFNLNLQNSVPIVVALILLVLDRQLKLMSLSWKLDSNRGMQTRIDRLAKFRNEVINSLYAGTPKRKKFKSWENNFHTWEKKLIKYLKANFPYAVFEMFEDQGMIPSIDFEHLSQDKRIRKKHRSYLRRIAKHLKILEMLIQQNTSLTKEREPTLVEVLTQTEISS
jgi:hypothetical protein